MRVSRFAIPILVVATLVGGYALRTAFTQPTTRVEMGAAATATTATVSCVVEGLKCKGTAGFFGKRYEGRRGIGAIETFASEHVAVITYDPQAVTPQEIREIMEAPVRLADGREVRPFRCIEMTSSGAALPLGPRAEPAPAQPARPPFPW